MKIKINQDYYDIGSKLFCYRLINLQPGVTILTGCNGSGKTTLLSQLRLYCRRNNIECLKYDNFKDGGSKATDKYSYFGNMDIVLLDITSSEGERIFYNLFRFAQEIKQVVPTIEKGGSFFLLLDAIDSGLDAVAIERIKKELLYQVKDFCEGLSITPYIVVTSNTFELSRNENCISLADGKYHQVKTYNQYRKIVNKTHEMKKERYGING